MTIEEAIKHAEEVSEENQERANSNILTERNGTKFLYDGEEYKKCYKCAEEHRQLAEWLKDYKRLLEQEPLLDKIRAEVEALNQDYYCEGDFDKCKDYVLDILDEYRGE